MRKSLIIFLMMAMGVFFSFFFECFAADEIKVGAVQPITGRFAFAGVQINQGLEDALNMANEEGMLREYLYFDESQLTDEDLNLRESLSGEFWPDGGIGRRTGLKIPWPLRAVRVRPPLRLLGD